MGDVGVDGIDTVGGGIDVGVGVGVGMGVGVGVGVGYVGGVSVDGLAVACCEVDCVKYCVICCAGLVISE